MWAQLLLLLLSVAETDDPEWVAKEGLPLVVYQLIHESDNLLLASGGDQLIVSWDIQAITKYVSKSSYKEHEHNCAELDMKLIWCYILSLDTSECCAVGSVFLSRTALTV